jgi:hypothetical protein
MFLSAFPGPEAMFSTGCLTVCLKQGQNDEKLGALERTTFAAADLSALQ